MLKAILAEPKVAVSHFFAAFIFIFGQTALKRGDQGQSAFPQAEEVKYKKASLGIKNSALV